MVNKEILYDYQQVILDALKYQIGDIKKAKTDNIFLTNKFIFKFPRLNKKEQFMIYAYDRDELNYHEQKIDGILIYSGGKWVKNGTWIDEFNEYVANLVTYMEDNREELEIKLLRINYEKDKYNLELTHQIGKTFNDNVFENGVLLSSVIDLLEDIPSEFDSESTIQTILTELFDVEIFAVLK